MSTRARLLIWSNEQGAWWRPGRRGCTRVIEFAGEYNDDDAVKILIDSLSGEPVNRYPDLTESGDPVSVMPEVLACVVMFDPHALAEQVAADPTFAGIERIIKGRVDNGVDWRSVAARVIRADGACYLLSTYERDELERAVSEQEAAPDDAQRAAEVRAACEQRGACGVE